MIQQDSSSIDLGNLHPKPYKTALE
jgi:hypothetical protein